MANIDETKARLAILARQGLNPFHSWESLLIAASHGDETARLYYWAPLDRHPVRVHIRAVYRNGRIRVSPGMAGACAFVADESHLSRFFTRSTARERFARAAAEAVDRALVELACVEGQGGAFAAEARAVASRLREAGAWRLASAIDARDEGERALAREAADKAVSK